MPMRSTAPGLFLASFLAVACLACAARGPLPAALQEVEARRAIESVLDDWHRAASAADGPRYLGHLAPEAVFLGTDPGERWSRAEFEAFCEPYFSRGVGWTYEPRERHVAVAGEVAWVDERLWNESYGDCRGTAVLCRSGSAWRIVHYSLTMLVPNERAQEVVRVIRAP